MNQFNFGVIDTSEMTLPVVNPPSFTSADQMLVLKQIDVVKREGNDV